MFESKIRMKEVVPHVMWTWSWEGWTTGFKIQKLNERGIYTKYLQNDEWAPLWADEDKAQRVHAMMVYWYKLQWHLNVACKGVNIGDFWLKQGKFKNSHKGCVVQKFRTRGGVMRKFRTNTIHPPFCNFWSSFKWWNFLAFEGGKCWLR